jgi:hypothetical protein
MRLFGRKPEPERPLVSLAELSNEIAQLESLRDDGPRVAKGSGLQLWIKGALFATLWMRDQGRVAGVMRPSAAASLIRSGQKVEGGS